MYHLMASLASQLVSSIGLIRAFSASTSVYSDEPCLF